MNSRLAQNLIYSLYGAGLCTVCKERYTVNPRGVCPLCVERAIADGNIADLLPFSYTDEEDEDTGDIVDFSHYPKGEYD